MAKKNIRDIVEDYSARITAKPSSRNLGEFLSIWPEVKQLLDEGWSGKRIWAALHDAGVIKAKYSTFISHIKRHSKPVTATATTTIETPKEDEKNAGAAKSAPAPEPVVLKDKSNPAASWGKPIERNPNTTAGRIPKFGLDQSKEEDGKF
jgi:hypothetical protein